MNKSIRIRSDVNTDKSSYLNIKLDQNFDFLDILSLKISQDDIYQKFCANYGVVVGRVTVNEGFGVPNAKVSIFIPIDDIDKENPLISGFYPYEYVSDKNDGDKRYNLLSSHQQKKCHIPVGSFPDKREFLDNDSLLEIYEKYYKFTTTTNQSGDFMIFGAPIGVHKLHIDADLSDLGVATIAPYDLTRGGSNSGQFESPSQFKKDDNLDGLTQIQSGDMSVDIKSFWGNNDGCDIGINRVDYNIPQRVEPAALFIGSVLNDTEKHGVNRRCRPRWKAGKMEELETGVGRIEMIRKTEDGKTERKNIGGAELIDGDGTWAYQIPMNLSPLTTDEEGNLVPSEDPTKGLFTEADVRFRISMYQSSEGKNRKKAKYLVPHNPKTEYDIDYAFGDETRDESFFNMRWNKIYTARNYIPRMQANLTAPFEVDSRGWLGIKETDRSESMVDFPYNRIDTTVNPLFTIIMVILGVIVWIVKFLNSVILPIINWVIYAIRIIWSMIEPIITFIKDTICWIISYLNDILGYLGVEIPYPDYCDAPDKEKNLPGYIGCIGMSCDGQEVSITCSNTSGDTYVYAPGCCCESCETCEVCGDDPTDNWGDSCDCPDTADDDCHINSTDIIDNLEDPQHIHPMFHMEQSPSSINANTQDYITCQAAKLATYFEMYNFDFYNDWINGNLYFYLFKASDGGWWNGNKDFCDIEDTDEGIFGPLINYIVDTATDYGVKTNSFLLWDFITPVSEKTFTNDAFRSGIIKLHQVDEETAHYYYAPVTSGGIKLFATDITSLGSTQDCDIDGVPKFIQQIPSTTYSVGPLVDTLEVRCSGTSTYTVVTESGIIGDETKHGLFMDVNILGLNVNYCQSRNVRLQSELGRTTDTEHFVGLGNSDADIISINNQIGALSAGEASPYNDIDHPVDSPEECGQMAGTDDIVPFYYYDEEPLPLWETHGPLSQSIEDEYSRFCIRGCNTHLAISGSNFDNSVTEMYNNPSTFASHVDFRGFNESPKGAGDAEFYRNKPGDTTHNGNPYWNSYYFYFGGKPGMTAIDKLIKKYLTPCDYVEKSDLSLQGVITNVTSVGGTDGELEIQIIGGVTPYVYEIKSPDGTITIVNDYNNDTIVLLNQPIGDYLITVTDIEGNNARGTFTIIGPGAMGASIQYEDVSIFEASDGVVICTALNGGTSPYEYTIEDVNSGTVVVGPASIDPNVLPVDLATTLAAGVYMVIFADDSGDVFEIQFVINEPPEFTSNLRISNIPCNGETGSIRFQNTEGGVIPWVFSITGPGTGTNESMVALNLNEDNYTMTLIDDTGAISEGVTVFIDGVSIGVQPLPYIHFLENPPKIKVSFSPTATPNAAHNGAGGQYTAVDPVTSTPYDYGVYYLYGNNHTIDLTFGGVAPVLPTPNWDESNPLPTNSSVSPLTATYEDVGNPFNPVTVAPVLTNTNECIGNASIIVKVPEPLILTLAFVDIPSCNQGCPTGESTNGKITVDFGGGIPASPSFNGETNEKDWVDDTTTYKLTLHKVGVGQVGGVVFVDDSTNQYTFETSTTHPIGAGEYYVRLYDLYLGNPIPSGEIYIEYTGIIVGEPAIVGVFPISISDTTATIQGQGGTGPYTYRIRTHSGPGAWIGYQSSGNFSSLTTGTVYDAQAKDSVGCESPINNSAFTTE